MINFQSTGRNATSNTPLRKFFEDAMIAGQVRGSDGFGMFQLDKAKGNNLYVHKLRDSATKQIDDCDQFTNGIIADVGYYTYTIGHHRAATTGAATDDNTHPFEYEVGNRTRIIGVHNGSLYSWRGEEDGKKFKVDSDWLIHQIGKHGPSFLGKIHGAAALVWVDTDKPDEINMFTNGERPLHIARVATGGALPTLLLASEAEMLYWLAARNKISIANNEIMSLRSMRHYRLVADANDWVHSTEVKRDPEVIQKTYGSTTTNSRSWDYRDSVKTELEQIIARALDDAAVEQLAPTASSIELDQIEQELTRQASEFVVETKPARKRLPRATPEEAKLLKQSVGINPGKEVIFEGQLFVEDFGETDVGTLLGDVVLEDSNGLEMEYEASVRHISRASAEAFIGILATAKALGAYKEQKSGGGLGLNVLCSVPLVPLTAIH